MGVEVKHHDGEPVRTTKVSRKNQVTLPVAALAAAHVKPGDVLRVEVEADGVFRLVRHSDPFLDALNELAGSAPGLSEATTLEELRNEWDR
ncbi:AbrB/MazE/SpoVT family DNA-binding domain-containing protein [Actinokineospora sp.]|uniref:AbrB/MazE/SpoVT family DNA-binding domain-containing protein n=1 Tax=Actinokineospora sp. TaxID=1872133 RepID=UPI003D6C19C0